MNQKDNRNNKYIDTDNPVIDVFSITGLDLANVNCYFMNLSAK